MTDNEIIKALECCLTRWSGNCEEKKCPFVTECEHDLDSLERHALALINRQKAEIEALKMILSTYDWISVKDYLPDTPDLDEGESYQPVWVTYLSWHDKVTPYADALAVWDGKVWRWWDSRFDGVTVEDLSEVIVEVTHWMPLPDPGKND